MQENVVFEDEEHRLPLCIKQIIEQHSPLKGDVTNKGKYLKLFSDWTLFSNSFLYLGELYQPPSIGLGFPSGYEILKDSGNVDCPILIAKKIRNYLRSIFDYFEIWLT